MERTILPQISIVPTTIFPNGREINVENVRNISIIATVGLLFDKSVIREATFPQSDVTIHKDTNLGEIGKSYSTPKVCFAFPILSDNILS